MNQVSKNVHAHPWVLLVISRDPFLILLTKWEKECNEYCETFSVSLVRGMLEVLGGKREGSGLSKVSYILYYCPYH